MKIKQIKHLLMNEVKKVSQNIERFCVNPGKDFTRKRKIPVEKLMLGIIEIHNANLTNELLKLYDVSVNTPTASAFIQQRSNLKPEAFEEIFTGIKSGFDLHGEACFDIDIQLKLTRKQTKETKILFKEINHYKFIPHNIIFDYLPAHCQKNDPLSFYDMNFRMVRFQITEDAYETVLINLASDEYPPYKLKDLYASRWGMEISFS